MVVATSATAAPTGMKGKELLSGAGVVRVATSLVMTGVGRRGGVRGAVCRVLRAARRFGRTAGFVTADCRLPTADFFTRLRSGSSTGNAFSVSDEDPRGTADGPRFTVTR